MFRALGALGRRQLAVWIDLALELVEQRLARRLGSSGAVIGVRPRFMGGNLSAY
ncbi:MAG: hypothetical protein ACRDTV_08450 [Mycobacterium sp.]